MADDHEAVPEHCPMEPVVHEMEAVATTTGTVPVVVAKLSAVTVCRDARFPLDGTELVVKDMISFVGSLNVGQTPLAHPELLYQAKPPESVPAWLKKSVSPVSEFPIFNELFQPIPNPLLSISVLPPRKNNWLAKPVLLDAVPLVFTPPLTLPVTFPVRLPVREEACTLPLKVPLAAVIAPDAVRLMTVRLPELPLPLL